MQSVAASLGSRGSCDLIDTATSACSTAHFYCVDHTLPADFFIISSGLPGSHGWCGSVSLLGLCCHRPGGTRQFTRSLARPPDQPTAHLLQCKYTHCQGLAGLILPVCRSVHQERNLTTTATLRIVPAGTGHRAQAQTGTAGIPQLTARDLRVMV